jgi:hypothetical protein
MLKVPSKDYIPTVNNNLVPSFGKYDCFKAHKKLRSIRNEKRELPQPNADELNISAKVIGSK